MLNKSTPDTSTITTTTEEFKEQSVKNNFSKIEYDLFHDEDHVVLPVIRVKRISLPNKGDKWKIFTDNKVSFIIEGSKLLKKEKEFLQTIDGFNFILSQAKIGIKSLNSFKMELKKVINNQQINDKVTEQKPKKTSKRKASKKLK